MSERMNAEWRLRVMRRAVTVSWLCLWSYAAHAQRPVAAAHEGAGIDRSVEALLARRITLTLTNVSLTRAVDSVSWIAKVPLQYQLPFLTAYTKPVSVELVNTPLGVALERVLDGTGLHVVPDGQGRLLVVPSQVSGPADSVLTSGTVTGRVVDSAGGRGLSGVTVKIAGTKITVLTQDSGRFTLRNVPIGQQLVMAKIFGYRPVERTVEVTADQTTTIRITLTIVPTVLSGVVTTATGQQRKIEVGNDITAINVDSVMRVAPITSMTDLLETRVPGLTVLHTSGAPGDPARIRLRGAGSVQLNNDPILIVDGVRAYASQSDSRNINLAPSKAIADLAGTSSQGGTPAYAEPSPLDQIDPASIATIEVLKGPSATAIYGSDAANGVIVVTTKHGRAGPTHWSLALGQGVNWLPGTWPVNYYRFGYDGTKSNSGGGYFCVWTDANCVVDSLVAFQALNDPRYSVFSHGSDQTATLTISGGVPTLSYSLTGSSTGQGGNLTLPRSEQHRYDSLYGPIPNALVHPDRYATYSVNGQLSVQASPTMLVTWASSLFNSNQQKGSLQQAIPQLEGSYISLAHLLFRDGTTEDGPLISNDVEQATDHQLTATNALTLTWQPRPWLPLNATGGLNTIQRTDQTYIPFGVNAEGPGSTAGPSTDTTGSYGLGRGTSQNTTLTVGTAIPFFRQFITLAVGGNVYSETTADFTAYTSQLAPGVSTPTSFPTDQGRSFFGQSTSAASTYGWYVEPRLNLSSRFFAAPGFRLDGGSGGSHSSGSVGGLSAFPKIDFSYIAVDRQNNRPVLGVLTLLRPRVAFGYAGTQPLPQDKLRLFNVGNFTLPVPGQGNLTASCESLGTIDGGATTVPTVCLSSLGNTQLRPERTSEVEGGFDADLWQGRVSLTYTQYQKVRHDAILAIPLAPSVVSIGGSATSFEKNVGEIRNTGTEVTVNAAVLQSRALSWNVGANLSNDNSHVVRLNPGQPPICFGSGRPCQGTRIIAGYPLFGEWARPIASFADANHDGSIEVNEIRVADSAVYVGQPSPKYQVNVNTGLTLLNGRLSVTATFAYQNGMTQNNLSALSSGGFALLPNAPNAPLATQAAFIASSACPQLIGQDCQSATDIGLIQTVNVLRFNDVSLNYELPSAFAARFHVPRMSMALQGSNLGLHTNYRGKDPNVNAFSTVSAGDETADLGQIPLPRTWWLKITVGN